MPSTNRIFLSVIFAVFGIASVAADQKVNVSIYYEVLDQPSIKFFVDNFKANTSDLLKFIDVHLIPFGNAKATKSPDNSLMVICTHGDVECHGNRVHACATKLMPKPEDQINFILCTMKIVDFKTTVETYPLGQCFDSLNNPSINRTHLEMCAAAKNDNLLNEFSQATNNALGTGHHTLPSVIFGKDQYDANLSGGYVKNFHDALCQRLGNSAGVAAICPSVTPVTSIVPTPTAPNTTTANPGGSSATTNSVTYLLLVLAVVVLFNLKLH